ncbi:MAG: ABC transporter ATP-binding protein/permease [Treponema sp.]|jgi:ATP-binding cassette subfamily B protein|nr:ABC transporter ATP-binding protein/permease [Treponema sp.]
MSDYFETEDVVKGYDRQIVARILSYIKPYRLMALATLLALGIATLGELAIPVIQQRVIDDAILARFMLVQTDTFAQERSQLPTGVAKALDRALARARVIRIGAQWLVPLGQDTNITSHDEAQLREMGIIADGQWYAFSYVPGDAAHKVIGEHTDLFLIGEHGGALQTQDLASLKATEIVALRSRDVRYIIHAVLVLLAILAVVLVFTFIQTWTTTLIGQQVMKDLRLALFQKTASQSSAFLSRHPVGRLVTRLTGDVETINEFFTSVVVAFLKDLCSMLGVLVTLFFLSPKLALVVLATLPPVLLLTSMSRLRARDAFRRQRTASSRVNAYLSERLSGVQVVQLFRGEAKSLREFGDRNGELLQANLGEMYVVATFRPLVEWFSILTVAVVIAVGSNLALNLSLSLGVLIAFINLVGMFYAPVMDIAEKYTLLQSAMAGGERVFKLLDTDERIPNEGKQLAEGTIRGHISFEAVHFAYKSGEEVLRGLSFTVQPGEMAAIVGYTGAGKTTIINVLTRLWDIDSGCIRLDGIPLPSISLEVLRRSVLPVLQEVFLFSGTVAENISLGLSIPEEAIVEAAKAVHAHDFISRLPQGYQTLLSEGATNISSGQRQLISFARVIAHNPAIVILDEATSSVDTETEGLIQLGMQRVLAGRTALVIAHRLSTIRHADRILVLSGGHLTEEGTHEDLIARGGLYAGLYRLQYEGT